MKRIFKASLLFSIAIALLISLSFATNSVEAASTSKATVIVNKLEIRNGAGTKYKVVGYLKKGDNITIFSKTKSGWSEVKYNKKKAYVTTKSLKFDAAKTIIAKVGKTTVQADKELVYPQISGLSTKSVQDKINNILRNHIKNSIKYKQLMLADLEEWKLEDDGTYPDFVFQWEYLTSYEIAYNKNNTLSIIMYDYRYMGGAHGSTVATTYNFSLSTGNRIVIHDVLKKRDNYLKVKRHAYKTMVSNENFFVGSLSDFDITRDTQFVYADGGIRLVFQEYEVAAYAYGHPKVNIPYTVYK
ncbi:PdaC/SigV domain-containing protein [Peribacillus huizhouensis]|uniref:Uncharacterized protein YraI n=1 Tax=Peribacillus huizhouensis TaxID=1501239 RepID=A0ABR6CTF2_9BACI|nr:DUF4163 domain-containing protein [Peribacillus huizhouensis]MBA9027627.1 uncharacterized protein YraI [Peribacillus huizhouensis]